MHPLYRLIKKKGFWFFLLAGSVLFLTAGLFFAGLFEKYDLDIFDYYSRHYRLQATMHPQVKVILIDDDTLKELAPILGRWPWKRSIYRDVIEFINMGVPKAIFLDIFFVEDDLDKKSDAIFAESITAAGNVHLGMNFRHESEQQFVKVSLPESINRKFSLKVKENFNLNLTKYQTYMLPVPDFAAGTKSLPVYTFDADKDGVFRRAALLFKYGKYYFPSMTLAALCEIAGTTNVTINKHNIIVGKYIIPVDSKGRATLNWYPAQNEMLSMLSILASRKQLLDGDITNLPIDPGVFKDSIVIIGAGASGTYDLKATPINPAIAGSELHSTLISNILKNEVVRPVDSSLLLLIAAMMSFITCLSLFYINQVFIKYLLSPVLLILITCISVVLFKKFCVYLPLGSILFASGLAYLISLGYISVTETREKLRIRKTFSKYLAPAVMHEVLRKYDELEPEVGKKIEATILFSDIRSFTTISENYPVELVVKLLNEYFEVMINEIHSQNGTLDKMIGDAIMAFWNSPLPVADHAIKAVTTAFRMQHLMVIMNEQWIANGYPKLKIGIGINTGEVIIGNIGAKARLDFTAIGDNVNLASRLEGLCKVYSAGIIISEHTYSTVSKVYPCRILDKVRVKGKLQPISIYEPEEIANSEKVSRWNVIFDSYLEKNWERTREMLDDFLTYYSNDSLAKLYLKRVNSYKESAPPEEWDGVSIMETK